MYIPTNETKLKVVMGEKEGKWEIINNLKIDFISDTMMIVDNLLFEKYKIFYPYFKTFYLLEKQADYCYNFSINKYD